MRVLLVTDEGIGIRLLKALDESDHELVGVVAAEGEGDRPSAVWRRAAEMGIRSWPAHRVREPDFAAELKSENIDLLVNVHSMYVVCAEVLEVPSVGCFNLHPGPLPEYAGMNVVSWAIFQQEGSHAVTLHEMTPRIDAGRIAACEHFPIGPKDTGLTVFRQCITLGVPMVVRCCDLAARGELDLEAQDLSRRHYYGKKIPGDRWIDWTWPAARVEAFSRACTFAPFPSPWGRPHARIDDRVLDLLSIEDLERACRETPGLVAEVTPEGARVAAGDGWVLVKKLRADGELANVADVLHPGDQFLDRSEDSA